MGNKKIIIVSGPTASGKTQISIDIAKEFITYNMEIVNFDSLLFYNDLNIGTAKPTRLEMIEVPHHLVNVASVHDEINASNFVKLAEKKINELHESNKIPILVGGSTFYLRSLIKGMYDSPSTSQEIKDLTEKIYREDGIQPFIDYLQEHDPKSLDQLHKNDHYRLMRAFEHHKMTGTPISAQKIEHDINGPYDFSKTAHEDWSIFHISLDIEKQHHWEIMLNRTKEMLKSGLLEEVSDLLKSGLSGKEKPLLSIGYKEAIQYINGEIESIEQLEEKIYFATRRLAKSQKTFLKKVTPKNTYHPLTDRDIIFRDIASFLED
jgi:tRNA dimethylallyltransferase